MYLCMYIRVWLVDHDGSSRDYESVGVDQKEKDDGEEAADFPSFSVFLSGGVNKEGQCLSLPCIFFTVFVSPVGDRVFLHREASSICDDTCTWRG